MNNSFEKIRLINILRIKKHIYFNNDPYFDSLMKKMTVKLMINAMLKYKSNETLLVLNYSDNKYDITSDNLPDDVYYNKKTRNWVMYSDKICIAFHNHTNNSNLSLSDVRELYSSPNLLFVIAITNNCKYMGVLYKPSIVSEDSDLNDLIKNDIDNYGYNNKLNNHSDPFEIMSKLIKDGHLMYCEFKNY